MGSSYSNVTLIGTDIEAVQRAFQGKAYAFAEGDCVVLFAEADEGAAHSGPELSNRLGCRSFSVSVHDDDILAFEVHHGGETLTSGTVPDFAEQFGLDPEVMELMGDVGAPPIGQPDSAALVSAVGRGNEESVRSALTGEFVFAHQRHQALAEALRLPVGAVGWGFTYLSEDMQSYQGPPLTTLG